MLLTYFPPILLIIVGGIAQSTFDLGAMFQNGVSLGVLAWFMVRMEPRLNAMEKAQRLESINVQESLDKVARSVLIFVLLNGAQPFKAQAETVLAELDEDHKQREQRKNEERK